MLSEQKLTEVDFIMAAKNNKRIKRMLEVHKRKNGVTPVIFKYQFKDTSSPEFYLVAIPNPDYDPEDTKNKVTTHPYVNHIEPTEGINGDPRNAS